MLHDCPTIAHKRPPAQEMAVRSTSGPSPETNERHIQELTYENEGDRVEDFDLVISHVSFSSIDIWDSPKTGLVSQSLGVPNVN
jgi:hypothetical protein